MDRKDVPNAVDIFQKAFADEHRSRFGEDARPSALVDVWSFLQSLSPGGFIGAYEMGELIGYAIFVPSLKEVQRRAILSGAVFKWSWNTLRRGEIRWRTIANILRNKEMFIRGGQRFRTSGDAQLLNVAVRPDLQGRGVATRLVTEGMRAMRAAAVPEVRLEVRPWNTAAVAVYKRTGWHEAGRTRDLEGEWIVMTANPEAVAPGGRE